MSDFLIRKTEIQDLDKIAAIINHIFEISISINYLNWILSDPDQPEKLNSIVVLNKKTIVGHVGYIKCKYYTLSKEIIGTHAILLCIMPKYRGKVGKRIFKEVSSIYDISIIYEGTKEAIRIYPQVGFKQIGHVSLYHTSFTVPKPIALLYGKNLHSYIKEFSISIIDIIKKYTQYKIETVHSNSLINLKKYENHISYENIKKCATLSNYPDSKKIEWFIKVPFLDSHIYTIYKNDICLGILYLYIRKYKGYCIGRVNHLPNLGENINEWLEILIKIEAIFRKLNCISYSIYATHPKLIKALDILCYRNTRNRAIWLLDEKGYMKNKSFHLTYIEGDHGFRNI